MALPNPDNSYGIKLATQLQLIVDQPMSDIMTKLVNRDFEGDFFKEGDTVQVAKPDPNSVAVEVGVTRTGGNFDTKLSAEDIEFADPLTLTINKSAKYAFLVSQVQKAEGKWTYDSLGLDIAGHNLRKGHNTEICQMLCDDAIASTGGTVAGHVYTLGTPTAPVTLSTVDDIYTKVALPMYTKLYANGAITASAKVPFGSNPAQKKYDTAGMFIPPVAMEQLLQSKYLTDRSTTQADDKVETATIGKLLGMEVALEPALDPANKDATSVVDNVIDITGAGAGVFMIVAGTRNCITKANKVLPPTSYESHTRFAMEYHGLEIYAQEIIEPKSAVVAFCKIEA